jgi:CRP-like cAMP-binding protein
VTAAGGPLDRAASLAAKGVGRTWANATPESIARLVETSTLVERATGTLLEQGERPSRVALVLDGTYVGTWLAPDGRVANGGIVHARFSQPGQFVGVATLAGAPIISGVDAVTPVTMLTWPSETFRAIAASDPALTLALLDRSIFAIHLLNHLMQLRTFTSAANRLAGVLVRNEAFGFGDAPPLGRGQLAALAGVTPRMVSSILRRWEAARIVRRVGASGLELVDRAALVAEAAALEDFPPPELPGA